MVEKTPTSASQAAAIKTGVAPPKDTRYKTEDVTNTKGLSFTDFGLSKDV
jgi:ATP-dependent RNA helicase DDX6/DHH1